MSYCATSRWVLELSEDDKRALLAEIKSRCLSVYGGCLVWTGTLNGTHPQMSWGGRTFRPYRAWWTLHYGPIPYGMLYRHGPCGALCMALEHGRGLGNAADNAADMAADGTHRNTVKTHCPYGHEYGRVDRRGFRVCTICQRGHSQRYKDRLKDARENA